MKWQLIYENEWRSVQTLGHWNLISYFHADCQLTSYEWEWIGRKRTPAQDASHERRVEGQRKRWGRAK